MTLETAITDKCEHTDKHWHAWPRQRSLCCLKCSGRTEQEFANATKIRIAVQLERTLGKGYLTRETHAIWNQDKWGQMPFCPHYYEEEQYEWVEVIDLAGVRALWPYILDLGLENLKQQSIALVSRNQTSTLRRTLFLTADREVGDLITKQFELRFRAQSNLWRIMTMSPEAARREMDRITGEWKQKNRVMEIRAATGLNELFNRANPARPDVALKMLILYLADLNSVQAWTFAGEDPKDGSMNETTIQPGWRADMIQHVINRRYGHDR